MKKESIKVKHQLNEVKQKLETVESELSFLKDKDQVTISTVSFEWLIHFLSMALCPHCVRA